MRTTIVLAALCGMATAAVAQQQPVLQAQPHAGRVLAERFAMGKIMSDGSFHYTTPWMDIVRSSSGTDTTWNSAFDAYQGDVTNPTYPPIGFNTCGTNEPTFCSPCPPAGRWFFGAAFYGPMNLDDMTVGTGFEGADAGRISGAWNHSSTPQRAVLLIATYEDFGPCTLPAGSNPIGDAVLLDFGLQVGGAGYFSFDEELVGGTPPMPFTIGLPANGTGAYEQIILNAEPIVGQPLPLATGAGVQNMYWGTDDHVPNPTGRIGTSGPNTWRDANAPFGTYELPGDCIAPVPPAGGCPTQLNVMIQFWSKDGGGGCGCVCNYDQVTGPNVCDVFDFLEFGNMFSAGDPCACDLDQVTGPGVCDVFDFLEFGNLFSAGC